MSKRIVIKYIVFLIVVLFPGIPAVTQGMDLHLKTDFAESGDGILAAVRFDIPPDYHAYANDPGATGLPTRLEFVLEDEGAMPTIYPTGASEPDLYNPAARVNIYKGAQMILARLPRDSLNKIYVANLELLLCSSQHCMPLKESFTGKIPDKMPHLDEVEWRSAAETLLQREGESAGAITMEEGIAPPPEPDRAGSSARAPQMPAIEPGGFNLDLSPHYADESMEIYSLGGALMFGLIAGLLLNAMPCVLPVLTMKITGLLQARNVSARERTKSFRRHNLCFAAGILTFFTLLAILLGAADLMWGQLFQNPILMLCLLLLVFLMGLSMLGVFNLPALDLRIGENTKNPMLKSYLTGLISTFLATPCSGPLLGGALAWAFLQPLPVLVAVFWSVGIGMALPYLAFSVWPDMVRILPKPGKWMYVFEHILGFLLLGTALYLFTILPEEKHTHILIVLLALSAVAWLWGRFCGLDAPLLRKKIAGCFCVLALGGAIWWIVTPGPQPPHWRNFSPAQFIHDLGSKNMLVEFTADWCPNCKFLEATVLTGRELRAWQKDYNLELVRVDLTRSDPDAQRLLQMLGSKSIPLTAIFASGKDSNRPLVLRDIYGKQTLNKALSAVLAGT